MDEIPVYFDLTSKYTYDIKGKKTISIRSTKGTKQRCTFLLSVASDGTMLPPYVILKSKNLKPFKNTFEDFCVLRPVMYPISILDSDSDIGFLLISVFLNIDISNIV